MSTTAFYRGRRLTLKEVAKVAPTCGEDFCAGCGDCLKCYWSDPCGGDEEVSHTWNVPDEVAAAAGLTGKRVS